MKLFEDYKGVAIIYLVITIVSIFCVSSVNDRDDNKQVNYKSDNKVVINYTK